MNDTKKNEQKEETKIYLTTDSTLQTSEEHRHDQSVDPRKDTTVGVSRDDLNETETDRYRNRVEGTGDSGQNS